MGEMEKMGEMGEMATGMHVECTDTSGSIWHVGGRDIDRVQKEKSDKNEAEWRKNGKYWVETTCLAELDDVIINS